jgi:adenylate cyclase, class 2
MIEVELKYRLDDPESLLAALIARGAAPGPETVEHDIYFAHPARDFAVTDEALRLRWDGRSAVLTYKGPLLDSVSKSREELELDLSGDSGLAAARQILGRLGFQEVRPVEKRRTKCPVLASGLPVLVTIDDVTGLGLFVELESSAEPADFEQIRDHLLAFAESLGLKNSERRSYLQLLQIAQPEFSV